MAAEITLITGLPGAGKTSLAVDLMETEFKGRLLFVDGIPDLTIEHHPIDVLNWPDDAPDGCVIFVDEVQRKWRPTGPGAKLHESIVALETHRHRGIDIVLMTQNPKLVHTNVRNLVNRHLHVLNTKWKGRKLYEWAECSVNLSYASCLNVRQYKLPKKTFSKYKSASEHIKSPLRIPPAAYLVILLLVVLGGLAYYLFNSFTNRESEPIAAETPAPKGNVVASLTGSSKAPDVVFDPLEFMPRVATRPETAPAFDPIRKVVAMPVVAGGACFRGECKCYTQQGTDAGLSHADCLHEINNPRFDAYAAPQAAPKTSPAPVQSTPSPKDLSPEVKHVVAKASHDDQLAVTAAAKTARLVSSGSLQ